MLGCTQVFLFSATISAHSALLLLKFLSESHLLAIKFGTFLDLLCEPLHFLLQIRNLVCEGLYLAIELFDLPFAYAYLTNCDLQSLSRLPVLLRGLPLTIWIVCSEWRQSTAIL